MAIFSIFQDGGRQPYWIRFKWLWATIPRRTFGCLCLIAIFCYCLSLQDKLLSRLDDADHIKTNGANNDENEVEKHAH